MSTPEILGHADNRNDLWSRRISSGPGVLLYAGRVAHFLCYSIETKILLKFSWGVRRIHFFFFFFFLQYSSIYCPFPRNAKTFGKNSPSWLDVFMPSSGLKWEPTGDEEDWGVPLEVKSEWIKKSDYTLL